MATAHSQSANPTWNRSAVTLRIKKSTIVGGRFRKNSDSFWSGTKSNTTNAMFGIDVEMRWRPVGPFMQTEDQCCFRLPRAVPWAIESQAFGPEASENCRLPSIHRFSPIEREK